MADRAALEHVPTGAAARACWTATGNRRLARPPIAPYPGLPRLWFAQVDGDVRAAMGALAEPRFRYGYINESYPLATYQTVFASVPGSAEMPSAAYPFTERVVNSLRENGVGIARLPCTQA